MVIVDRKFNREMPVGSMVKDIERPNDGVFHVTSRPRTSGWGTEMSFSTDSGCVFEDNPKYYVPFI